jgi:hypothetical protein
MTGEGTPSRSGPACTDDDSPEGQRAADRELLGSWDRASRDRVLFLLTLVGLTALVVSVPVSFSTPRLLQFGLLAALSLGGVLAPATMRELVSRWVALGVTGLLVSLEYLARPDDVGYLVGFLALVAAGALASAIARRSTS